jgi:hypothetical protein
LRHRGPRKRRKECLAQGGAERQQKEAEEELNPAGGHSERAVFWPRACIRDNVRNNFDAAAGLASFLNYRSSLRRRHDYATFLSRKSRKRKGFRNKIYNEHGADAIKSCPKYLGRHKRSSLPNPGICEEARQVVAPYLRPAHVGSSAGIDLDGFTFFDEERDVNLFAGLKNGRLGHVAGGIAAETFGRLDNFETNGSR